FDLAARAIAIAQSDAFSTDTYFSDIIEQYGQLSGEDLALVIAEGREDLIYDAVYTSENPEQTQALIELIEDDTLRADLALEFSPNAAGANEADSAMAVDVSLRGFASSMAREGRFQEALEAVADIASPYEQVRALINIAQCHANSATVLGDDMRLILEGLR
ncbi:MAG: hypothetical protein AAFP03_11985, partial [Cyanobacteria bacterium J06598_3]